MTTDEFGRERASEGRGTATFFRNVRVFLLGVAVGAGVCLGMGPPLPLIDMPSAEAAEYWRALLDPRAIAFSISTERAAMGLLQQRLDRLATKLSQIGAHP